MPRKVLARIATTGTLFATFTLGYVCGSVSQPPASAQIPGGLLDTAGKGSGSLGAAGQLGSSVTRTLALTTTSTRRIPCHD